MVPDLRFGENRLVYLSYAEPGDGGRAAQEELYLYERIRDVRQGSDGHPYLLTDNGDGPILRVVSASR